MSQLAPLSTLLRDARRRAGLSQSSLARSAGLSLSTIKSLERGRPASLPTAHSGHRDQPDRSIVITPIGS